VVGGRLMIEHEQQDDAEQMTQEEGNAESKDLTKTFRLAGFWTRLYAYLIDLIAVGALTSILITPLFSALGISTGLDWIGIQLTSIGLLGALYFAIMTKVWSQTLGKMIVGLRVIQADGEALTWSTVLIREIAGRFISQLFGLHLGYLWGAFHPKKQTWHDQFVDTFVIIEERVAEKQNIQIPVQS
jgi:uncharacterized RDD family membrane protein YckC